MSGARGTHEFATLLRAACRDAFEGASDDALGPLLLQAAKRSPLAQDVAQASAARSDELDAASSTPPALTEVVATLRAWPTQPPQTRARALATLLRVAMAKGALQTARVAEARHELTRLPRIGPKLAEKLVEQGIDSIAALARFVPARYDDLRAEPYVLEVPHGDTVAVRGVVVSYRGGFARGRFMASAVLRQTLADGREAELDLRWFHRVSDLKVGARVAVLGALREFRGRASMVHPEVFDDADEAFALQARYATVRGLSRKALQAACAAAVHVVACETPQEALSPALREAEGLPSLAQALLYLHNPPPDLPADQVAALNRGETDAQRRLVFEELLVLQLRLLRLRARWTVPSRYPCRVDVHEELAATVPFTLTRAQRRVLGEIWSDMAGGAAMLRLVQGDVGAGKTVVAFGAVLAAVRAGGQAAMLVPTELLTEQHMRSLRPWCEACGVRVASLHGRMPRATRSSLTALCAAGKIDLLIGTHALMSDDVGFRALSLVIVDEQHRFGVEQRAVLRNKGSDPHMLALSATPIPRTLALTAWGELEISVLDELPPGRMPIQTRILSGRGSSTQARELLARALDRGVQGYLIVPLVEPSEELPELSDVQQAVEELRALRPGLSIAAVHGRMSGEEKEDCMRRFRDGEAQLLVATTVVEVGVDVPAARVILIEHADRYGLAQLHQLRGRVGRGDGASVAVLQTLHEEGGESLERLSCLVQSTDGFVIAQRDLELRGPGDVFGRRQAGAGRIPGGAVGLRLLERARAVAKDLLAQDPGLQREPGLAQALREAADAEVFAGEVV